MAEETDPQQNQGGQSGNPQKVVLSGENWNQFIPDDLKDDANFKPFEGKPVGDVFRSFVNAQRMIGADKFIVPAGKNDTPEIWNEVFNKLGRPGQADAYQFEAPKLPKGVTVDEKFEKEFKNFAHQSGLSQKQAASLHKFYHDYMGNQFELFSNTMDQSRNEMLKKAEETLKTEYGSKYESKVDLAKKVIRTYGGKPEETTAFVDRFGNDPLVIRILAKFGDLVSEDRLRHGETIDWDIGAEAARKKATDIMGNELNPLNKAYRDKKHPQHLEAVNEVERLFQLASAGG